MKRTIKLIAILFLSAALSTISMSCGDSNSYSSYDETYSEETYVNEYDCIIKIDDYESTIIMNRDKTVQLIDGRDTLYGSWIDCKNFGEGIEMRFRGPRGRIYLNIKDDYLYFNSDAAKANDPHSRYHIRRSPKK